VSYAFSDAQIKALQAAGLPTTRGDVIGGQFDIVDADGNSWTIITTMLGFVPSLAGNGLNVLLLCPLHVCNAPTGAMYMRTLGLGWKMLKGTDPQEGHPIKSFTWVGK
jgi:hypothetical protein